LVSDQSSISEDRVINVKDKITFGAINDNQISFMVSNLMDARVRESKGQVSSTGK